MIVCVCVCVCVFERKRWKWKATVGDHERTNEETECYLHLGVCDPIIIAMFMFVCKSKL